MLLQLTRVILLSKKRISRSPRRKKTTGLCSEHSPTTSTPSREKLREIRSSTSRRNTARSG